MSNSSNTQMGSIIENTVEGMLFIPRFLIRAFKGDVRLWQAYFILPIPTRIILKVMNANPNFLDTLSAVPLILWTIFYLFAMWATFIAPVAVWRSSKNCSSAGWAALARIAVVVILPFTEIATLSSDYMNSKLSIAYCWIFILLPTLSMVIVYFIGEALKSKKIQEFNETLFTPYTLIIRNVFILLFGFYAGLT